MLDLSREMSVNARALKACGSTDGKSRALVPMACSTLLNCAVFKFILEYNELIKEFLDMSVQKNLSHAIHKNQHN